MNTNAKLSDQAVVAAVIDPDAYAPSTVTSGWVALSTFEAIMATVMVGTFGTGHTVDAKLEQATDSGGTAAKDVTGKAITQLTEAASPAQDDSQAIIELRSEELDVDNGFTHVRLSVTIGDTNSPAANTTDLGAIIHGFAARYQQDNASSVAEVKA
jgi:hypothetical protein